jgi:hypothetical protein
MSAGMPSLDPLLMTLLWFVVWLIANNIGAHEPLMANPVNAWTGTLIVAIALDLSAAHATRGVRSG